MTKELVLIIIPILLLIFLVLGLYIHSILLSVGIIGIVLLEGPAYVTGFLASDPFIRTASYSLSTIPLFVLMAQFIVRSGIISDVYTIVYNLSKGKNWFLGVLTVFAGALMGAVSGSTAASSAAMGQVSVPQLMKRGYSDGVAGATVAAAGSLSAVIPPSIILILYGVATETPIGKLFMGSLIPGIIMTIVIIICMLFALKLSNKNDTEQHTRESVFAKESISTLRVITAVIAVLLIAVIVFVGIYAGFFTPTEAGAIGAFVSFLIALLLKRVNKTFFHDSFSETVKITSMVLMIMIGAQIFGRFVTLSLLPRKLIDLLSAVLEYPIILLILLSFIYYVLFMFIEGAAVIIMTAPIMLPIITEMGIDHLWFGVFVSVICTIGLLSPPVGLSVYAVSGVTNIPSGTIFRYAFIYSTVLMVVVCGLLIMMPSLATWLPSRM